MMTKILPVTALVLGLILLALSALWPKVTDKNKLWSPEQHEILSTAARSAHDSQHGHSHSEGDHSEDEHEVSKEKLRKSLEEFDRARNGRDNLIAGLKWSGIGFITVGAIAFYVAKNNEG